MKSIQILRKEAELTQQELADKLGLNRSYVSRIENGVVPLNDAVLQMKFCEALGVPLSEVAPDRCRDRGFPIAVHGRLVYDMGELYDVLKENSKRCENCKKQFEAMVKSVVKTIREPLIWAFVMNLHHPANETTLKALQAGGSDWNKEWRGFAEAYYDYLEENWDERWPRLIKAYERSVEAEKSQDGSGSTKGERVQ